MFHAGLFNFDPTHFLIFAKHPGLRTSTWERLKAMAQQKLQDELVGIPRWNVQRCRPKTVCKQRQELKLVSNFPVCRQPVLTEMKTVKFTFFVVKFYKTASFFTLLPKNIYFGAI